MPDKNSDSFCDSDSSGNLKQARNKAWMPKVKTGCVTCKARRVKCDEEKPSCHRCILSGRECKGYPSPPPKVKGIHWHHWKPRKADHIRLERAMSEEAIAVTIQSPESVLNTSWPGSSREKRSFFYFLTVMPSELSGLFTDSAFWSHRMAQAAAREPAIRHLLIAFAAAHEQYAWGRLKMGKTKPSEEGARFVLEQCNSSIKHLLRLVSTITENRADSLSKTTERWRGRVKLIVAALLFTYIAQLQNNRSDAFRHLQGGLKLLYELEADQAASAFAERDSQCLIPMSGLRYLFQMLNVQARVLRLMGRNASWDSGSQSQSSNQWPSTTSPSPIHTSPRAYTRFLDAQNYSQVLYSHHLTFLERSEAPSPLLEPAVRAKNEAAELASLRTALTWSFDAFETLVRQSSEETLRREALRIKHIRLYHTLLDVWVQAATPGTRGATAKDTDGADLGVMQRQMKEILSYCEDLKAMEIEVELPAAPTSALNGRPLFCPGGPGVVLPLYIISIWGHDRAVRRQAVDMLIRFPRCEGLWDGALAARSAMLGTPSSWEGEDGEDYPGEGEGERGMGMFPVLPMRCVAASE